MFEPAAPHRNASIEPSTVNVNAGAMKSGRLSQGMSVRLRCGVRINVRGMSLMIAADQPKVQLRSAAMMSPRSDDGKYPFHFLGQSSMIPITKIPRTMACALGLSPLLKYPISFCAAVSVVGVVIPSRLSVWRMMITRAMPDVKPRMTGAGMNAM